MRSDGRPEINEAEVRQEALAHKVSAFLDNEKIQEFINAFGITKENLKNEDGNYSENTVKALTEASDQFIPIIMGLAQEDLGLEISADEAMLAFQTAVAKKMENFTFAEVEVNTNPSDETSGGSEVDPLVPALDIPETAV